MPDIQQYKASYPQYRYSIPQLLELSATVQSSFDLSKFTYEAARAGVIPPLEICAMSSRRSSASYMKTASVESMSTADLLVFQGNRVQHPARQPKLPPPAERQKDEGFAKFLKKHSSPTHNRVTAGGRIVPMEPRSPPAFSLSPVATHQTQSVPDNHGINSVEKNGQHMCAPAIRTHPQYTTAELRKQSSPDSLPTTFTQFSAAFNENPHPGFAQGHIGYDLTQAHMSSSYAMAPMSMPIAAYMPDIQVGGPITPQAVQPIPVTYNGYYGSPGLGSVTAASAGLVSDPSWGSFEPIVPQHNISNSMLPAFQLLAAWEQHYVNLDVQLKNIDRHRAMHHLDPYLAEQRKIIVQQRSDAKDTVKEYSRMLGVRRTLDSSQESFATTFNVEAPSYLPSRKADLADMMESKPLNSYSDTARQASCTEQLKAPSGRRPIPIVPPPEQSRATFSTQQAKADIEAPNLNDLDEWGVQNKLAPPEIQREQSELSDMLQAEQRSLSNRQNDDIEQAPSSQTSVQSQGDVLTGNNSRDTEADSSTAITKIETNDQVVPRDTAEEIQQVVDAIGKPKGTITQVRLLDSRVISVEGQGIDLSSKYPVQPSGEKHWQKTTERTATAFCSQSVRPRDARKYATDIDQNGGVQMLPGKENASLAPRGHNKAATDAFLNQFNTVEDNVALATMPETRSLRTVSNGLMEERKSSGGHQPAAMKSHVGRVPPGNTGCVSLDPEQAFPVYHATNAVASPLNAAIPATYDDLNNKSYSSTSVQNIHATSRLPQNFDGAADAQAQLAAAEKARSPRLLKRHGINGSAWYGPYCREVFERARTQHGPNRPSKTQGPWRNN